MHIVEYLDKKTGSPTGRYAKRFEEGGAYRDEPIPKKLFCVCDPDGNIRSITEVNFSQVIEVEGKAHCLELGEGEECCKVLDTERPIHPETLKTNKLKWLLDNYKMGAKILKGKRKGQRKMEKKI